MESILEHADPRVIISGHLIARVVQTPDAKSFFQVLYLPGHDAHNDTNIDIDEFSFGTPSTCFAPFMALLRQQAEIVGP